MLYRRLKETEAKLRERLLNRWNFDGEYWDPLVENSPEPVVFINKANFSESDFNNIIDYITKRATGFIYELTETGDDFEIDLSLFHPDCYETVYVDDTLAWIVYGSHESTITFGGEPLVNFIKSLFADRKENLNSWDAS